MKKFFISMALASLTMSASALRTTGGDNLVKNGSFDAPGYVQETPGGWNFDPMNGCKNLSVLPDWSLENGGMWNGGAEVIVSDEEFGDGDTRPETDNTFLRLFSDTDNSWTANLVYQVVEGFTAGTQYNLDFALMGKWGVLENGEWINDPDWYVVISEVDEAAAADANPKGKEVAKFDFSDVEQWWEAKNYTFTATQPKMHVQFVMNFQANDASKHTQSWMALDCVDIYDPNGTNGVAEIEVAEENAPAEYFNLQGVRVAEPVAGGLYIRRQGAKAAKVIL